MEESDEVEVRSEFYSTDYVTGVVLVADSPGDTEWMRSTYRAQDMPQYLRAHAERNSEADEVEVSKKLRRITEQHLAESVEGEWRSLE